MAISTAVLERAGLHVDPEEFDRLVAEALEEVVPLRPAPVPTSEFSDGELAVLSEGGLRFDPLPAGPTGREHPLVRTAAAYVALLGSSLSVAQAATHLGVVESRVRQRLGERTLYGIKQPSGWRLPRFQFAPQGIVPGIERVLPHLAPDLHPLEVVGWFTTPNPDLVVGEDERPVSPLDWLSAGLAPDAGAALAGDAGALA